MHGVVCLCVHLLFVCDTAVGDGGCAVMVGVYVHALAFVDVRAIFEVVCLLYVCARAVHERRCIGRVVGVCLWGRWAHV